MSLFIPITKVDMVQRLVYGTLSEEVPDKAGEILDYASAKPAFQEWSEQFRQATGGKSLGNVRAMHGAVAAGKLTDLAFDDAGKRIEGVAKIIDEDEWHKVTEGVYTGFSIGGGYARRWPDAENPALMRYTPTLSEVSLVDNPAVPSATFEIIKQDGTVELRKFHLHKEVSMHAPIEDSDSHIALLLEQLAWLEQEIGDDEEDGDILAHIQALQDFLSDEDAEDDDISSRQYADELAASGIPAATRKAHMAEYGEAIEKRFGEMAGVIESLQKRLTLIEAQPLPARGALRAREALEEQGNMTPERRVHELMKKALASPLG